MAQQWTTEETNFLTINYHLIGSADCAEKLDKTVAAIQRKARTLGISTKNGKGVYSLERLSPIVAESGSISDILRKMGLRAAGGNHRVIKRYIEKYSLNIDHFESQASRARKAGFLSALTYDEVFCEDSTAQRHNVKRWLRKLGRTFICELDGCGQGEEWRGKKISLILDHINGVNNDNRMENLRLVCPNCNATLDTHCGKNKNKQT